jgi:hypothetical protein
MRGVDVDGVTGVVAIHRKRRNQHCTVYADGVHGRNHIIARNLGRAVENGGPGTAWMVALIGVHLGV